MTNILMCQNIPVLNIDDFKVLNKELLPIGLFSHKDFLFRARFKEWLQLRDFRHRKNFKYFISQNIIKHNIGIAKFLKDSYYLSLADQYWIKAQDEQIDWQDINFFTNDFSDDVGKDLFFERELPDAYCKLNPSVSTNGFLPKYWDIIDGKRVLIKAGSGDFEQEPYNELIAAKIMKELQINHVEYSLKLMNDGKPISLCENFLNEDCEYVPAFLVLGTLKKSNNDNYLTHFIKCAVHLGVDYHQVKTFLNQMLTLDYLIENTDRHFGNFGLIRNVQTLQVKPAPIFDCGTSLWNLVDEPNVKSKLKNLQYITELNFKTDQLDNIINIVQDTLSLNKHISSKRLSLILNLLSIKIEQIKKL